MSLPVTPQALALNAIGFIEQGRTLTMACELAGIPYAQFLYVLDNNETLRDMYAAAERRAYDMMAEALLEIDKHPIYGQSDPKMAAIVSKNIQWFLSKRRATVYGEKITVEHTITADKAILDALQRGKARAQGQLPPPSTPSRIANDVIDLVPIKDDIRDLF